MSASAKTNLELPLGGGGCIRKAPLELLAALVGKQAELGTWTDTGVMHTPNGDEVHLSVDVLTPVVPDPKVFGCIAVHHCLADLYASGAVPLAACAIVGMPPGPPNARLTKDVLDSARAALAEEGVRLVGGHTLLTTDFLFGLAVMGFAQRSEREPVYPGDLVVLSKPLGSGVIVSALGEPAAPQPSEEGLEEAIATMMTSNAVASARLHALGAKAVTDVTGFGLVGHLVNLLHQAGISAKLYADRIPVIPDALRLCASRYPFCSMNENRAAFSPYLHGPLDSRIAGIIFDAQTSGGLLAIMPAVAQERLVEAHSEGWAYIIGELVAVDAESIEVRVG